MTQNIYFALIEHAPFLIGPRCPEAELSLLDSEKLHFQSTFEVQFNSACSGICFKSLATMLVFKS